MRIITSIGEIQGLSTHWKKAGLRVSLVPTMGFFHDGHLALMNYAKQHSDRVVVSLFVNPTQFGPNEDFEEYPRDPERDRFLAEKEGVDCLFCPEAADMYPEDFQTWVNIEGLDKRLCGASRPGHFRGVATIVTKLFNIVRPDLAVFGRKDFQQLQIIKRIVRDLNFGIEIKGYPIVREADGLAMSSRNKYLSRKERKSALCLFESLKMAEHMVSEGCRSTRRLAHAIERLILAKPGTRIDYIFLGDPETLTERERVKGETLLALAVYVGATRLIDNTILRPPKP